MPHTRWSQLRVELGNESLAPRTQNWLDMIQFTRGYILALDDLLQDTDRATTMDDLREKIFESRRSAEATVTTIENLMKVAPDEGRT